MQTDNTVGKMHETIPGLQPMSPSPGPQPTSTPEFVPAMQQAPGVMVTGPPPGTKY